MNNENEDKNAIVESDGAPITDGDVQTERDALLREMIPEAMRAKPVDNTKPWYFALVQLPRMDAEKHTFIVLGLDGGVVSSNDPDDLINPLVKGLTDLRVGDKKYGHSIAANIAENLYYSVAEGNGVLKDYIEPIVGHTNPRNATVKEARLGPADFTLLQIDDVAKGQALFDAARAVNIKSDDHAEQLVQYEVNKARVKAMSPRERLAEELGIDVDDVPVGLVALAAQMNPEKFGGAEATAEAHTIH